MLRFRQAVAVFVQLAILLALPYALYPAGKNGGRSGIEPNELREWLTYFSSDELEGRSAFSEGLGLAAAYIAEHLRSWGIRPGGDNGSYFQRVRVLGVKSDNRSTITVEAHGETRTFKNGEAIFLPPNVGGKRTLTADQIEFLGYGLDAPMAKHSDFAGRDVKGKVVIFIGASGPKTLEQQARRLLFGRARYATDQKGAIATIGPSIRPATRPSAPPRGNEPAPAGPQPPGQPAGQPAG